MPYSSCMQMQPITNMPAAKIAPPSITRNSASAISGSAKRMREPTSEPPGAERAPVEPVSAAGGELARPCEGVTWRLAPAEAAAAL